MNGTSMPLGRQELWKGTVKMVRDEWSNGVLLAVVETYCLNESSGQRRGLGALRLEVTDVDSCGTIVNKG